MQYIKLWTEECSSSTSEPNHPINSPRLQCKFSEGGKATRCFARSVICLGLFCFVFTIFWKLNLIFWGRRNTQFYSDKFSKGGKATRCFASCVFLVVDNCKFLFSFYNFLKAKFNFLKKMKNTQFFSYKFSEGGKATRCFASSVTLNRGPGLICFAFGWENVEGKEV